MLKQGLPSLALLACLHAGSLVAEDRTEFRALPQAGDAAQRLPDGETYTLGTA